MMNIIITQTKILQIFWNKKKNSEMTWKKAQNLIDLAKSIIEAIKVRHPYDPHGKQENKNYIDLSKCIHNKNRPNVKEKARLLSNFWAFWAFIEPLRCGSFIMYSLTYLCTVKMLEILTK